MTETISFVVHLPSKPEHRAEFEERLFHVLDTMASEPDFVHAWAHRQIDNPDTYVVYETWACSREYFLAHHLKKDYRQDYEVELPRLLAAPRHIDFLTPIRAYPQRRG